MKMSNIHGLYLDCLALRGVKIGLIPVAVGAFGDVYKGQFGGEVIAVKVIRKYKRSNNHVLLKVSLTVMMFFK